MLLWIRFESCFSYFLRERDLLGTVDCREGQILSSRSSLIFSKRFQILRVSSYPKVARYWPSGLKTEFMIGAWCEFHSAVLENQYFRGGRETAEANPAACPCKAGWYLLIYQSLSSQSGSPWVETSSSQNDKLMSSITCSLVDLTRPFLQHKDVMGVLHLMVCCKLLPRFFMSNIRMI